MSTYSKKRHISVLIDGRINSYDGIGRYTRCLVSSLRKIPVDSFRIEVLPWKATPRYSEEEGEEILVTSSACEVDLIHLLDYRVPLRHHRLPLIGTVHDVLRLVRPEYCYSDREFITRFGETGFTYLRAAIIKLRELTSYPPGITREPRSLHEEFYARMLALAAFRCAYIITPTKVVAEALTTVCNLRAKLFVSPYGVDHMGVYDVNLEQSTLDTLGIQQPFILYVGQARQHKALTQLFKAFYLSQAYKSGVQLVCVGQDFSPNAEGTQCLRNYLGAAGLPVGEVNDSTLAAMYTKTTMLIHLSEHEGFGFTPLEAIACGTQVIVRDLAVFQETLGNQATLVNADDLSVVSATIDQLLSISDNEADRVKRKQWAESYSWNRHANDVLSIYQEITR